jgi:signal transduction histidine kinase/CheY-like chemotaxis protein/HAMP domain-containing protein
MTTVRAVAASEGDGSGNDGSGNDGREQEESLLREFAEAMDEVRRGRLDVRLPRRTGLPGEVSDLFNDLVMLLERRNRDLLKISGVVGRDGRMQERLDEDAADGAWADGIRAINGLIDDLARPTAEIARVLAAVAEGDLSEHMALEIEGRPLRGEFLRIGRTVNKMVDQLSSFADEVTRVAREVGTEGKLGGQAQVKDVAGTWRDLTDNVNQLADNLTGQVRNIAQVTTAVARGDLSQKITVDARGEILELKSTVNTMVDQLSSFADEVTRVAREVGTEGKLGGQAQVKDVAGTWRHLTENVNQLASTLTSQLRAISVVSTAVARGDLTQQIQIAAMGEVAALRDTINEMIITLRETTTKNADQGWLDSNLARVGALLQGQRDLTAVSQMIMNEVAPLVNAQVGAFFLPAKPLGEEPERGEQADQCRPAWRMSAGYALNPGATPRTFRAGEGLVGQAAAGKQVVQVSNIPSNYLPISSGLGTMSPTDVVVLPVIFEGESLGVIEFGSVSAFSPLHLMFLQRLVGALGVTIASIQANIRTEELLVQSQRLAAELQNQSAELQRTNAELEEKASQLSEQNRNIEIKNMEIDAARRGVEEKAQQLARASQYKSEFLANMSHELRTPLNSLLLLSRLLADNQDRNLTGKQMEFARTIYNAGSELLLLIDDILDLSKIEAGRVELDPQPVALTDVRAYVEQAFVPQAEDKGLELRVHVSPELPSEVHTDAQRLQQILRNLLANAIKFTAHGEVVLTVEPAPTGMSFGIPELDSARAVYAFAVRDTGIGIVADKLDMIFEAFQQADGTTSRKYGGTGLGLSISKELAQMLGGVITVTSEFDAGSVFTLYLPDELPRMTYPAGNSMSLRMPEPPAITASVPDGRGPILRSVAGPSRSGGLPIDLAGITVLIVDDDVRNVFALTSALEMHGLHVLYADNGADGLTLLAEHAEVDIVLMDAMMPDLDGNATTKLIRGMPGGAELPVVFLTAKAMPGDRESSLAAGASDYVTKPVDKERLLSVMASWIARARKGAGQSARQS